MVSGTLSSCINHPSIEATGRCKQCSKPYCDTCAVRGPTGNFCSAECKQRHEVFVQRAAKLDDMRRDTSFFAKAWITIRKLIVFTIVALIIAVVVHYLGYPVPVVSDLINQYL